MIREIVITYMFSEKNQGLSIISCIAIVYAASLRLIYEQAEAHSFHTYEDLGARSRYLRQG